MGVRVPLRPIFRIILVSHRCFTRGYCLEKQTLLLKKLLYECNLCIANVSRKFEKERGEKPLSLSGQSMALTHEFGNNLFLFLSPTARGSNFYSHNLLSFKS